MVKKEEIMSKIPVKLRDKLLEIKGIFSIVRSKQKIQELNRAIESTDVSNWNNLNSDIDVWKRSLKKIALSTSVGFDIAINFFNNDIQIIKINKFKEININSPIIICVVKNDLKRMKVFYDHYRKIGIEKFAILDNGSVDGTFEWLMSQEDTDVYRTESLYTTNKRQSWINKLISFYGFNKWYMVVDSDELFVYQDMEKKTIQELTNLAIKKGYKRIRSITLDMYSENPMFSDNEDSNYLSQYVYFDNDNYNYREHYAFRCIDGGMRVRMFRGENKDFAPYLTKYPLLYFEKGDLQYNSHYSFPIYKNFEDVCWAGLMHYKFLSSDMKKYKEIAKSGAFYGGSYEYKQYIKLYNENKKKSFMHKNSKIYKNSQSLKYIKEIERIKW